MRVFFKVIIVLLVAIFIEGFSIIYLYTNDLITPDFLKGITNLQRSSQNTLVGQINNRQVIDDKSDNTDLADRKLSTIENNNFIENSGIEENDDKEDNVEPLYLSADELSYFKEIKPSEVLKLLELASRLKSQDIEAFYSMASGGITFKEMERFKEMLGSRLEEKDLDMLEELVDKNKKLYIAWKEARD